VSWLARSQPPRVLPSHFPPICDSVKGTAFALSSLFLPFGQVVNVYVEYFYVFRPEVPPLGRLIRPGTLRGKPRTACVKPLQSSSGRVESSAAPPQSRQKCRNLATIRATLWPHPPTVRIWRTETLPAFLEKKHEKR
jgi:hypothetical protein